MKKQSTLRARVLLSAVECNASLSRAFATAFVTGTGRGHHCRGLHAASATSRCNRKQWSASGSKQKDGHFHRNPRPLGCEARRNKQNHGGADHFPRCYPCLSSWSVQTNWCEMGVSKKQECPVHNPTYHSPCFLSPQMGTPNFWKQPNAFIITRLRGGTIPRPPAQAVAFLCQGGLGSWRLCHLSFRKKNQNSRSGMVLLQQQKAVNLGCRY